MDDINRGQDKLKQDKDLESSKTGKTDKGSGQFGSQGKEGFGGSRTGTSGGGPINPPEYERPVEVGGGSGRGENVDKHRSGSTGKYDVPKREGGNIGSQGGNVGSKGNERMGSGKQDWEKPAVGKDDVKGTDKKTGTTGESEL